MKRRRFLAGAGGTAGALALGACSWSNGVRQSVAATSTTAAPATGALVTTTSVAAGRPLLLVVNMAGGNDGLNTVVPVTGRYHDLRPAIGLSDEDLLPLTADYGLHPSLLPLAPRWDEGDLAVLHGVGIPGQSRSHFAASDVWAAADPKFASTGWIGRWLDEHPSAGDDPLLAIGLGGGRGVVNGLTASSTVIRRPDQFLLQTVPGMDATALADVLLATSTPAVGDSDALALVRAGIPRATEAVEILSSISTDAGLVGIAPNSATTLLQVAARVITLNLSTEVIVVEIGGFDTHTNQLASQANLLSDIAEGVANFLAQVDAAGLDRDVLVMTTSEFGRRVSDNGSGTDHGLGSAHLMIGERIAGRQVVGEAKLGELVDGDLPIDVDARSMYQIALDHLGGATPEVLDGDWETLGLI